MKKLISIIVALSMVMSLGGVRAEEKLAEPSEWAKDKVAYAYEIGIAKDHLVYAEPISREQFCELVYNLIIKVNGMLAAPVSDKFTDTANERVLLLNGAGIINGKSDTEFCPDDSLTRAESATIIVRMINKLMPMETTMMWYEFEDGDKIPVWATDSVQTICNLGFMNGVGDDRFAPEASYTAEQAIVTLVRVYDKVKELGADMNSAFTGVIDGFQPVE